MGDTALAILRAVEASKEIYDKQALGFDNESRDFVNSSGNNYSVSYP